MANLHQNKNDNLMSKTKLEYIWLDGYKPTQSLRSKTKIVKNFITASSKYLSVRVKCL